MLLYYIYIYIYYIIHIYIYHKLNMFINMSIPYFGYVWICWLCARSIRQISDPQNCVSCSI